jgi:hypothetical protein
LDFLLYYVVTRDRFNLLNGELNPICHLLALLGAHHILHVSRIRVKNSFLIKEGVAGGSTNFNIVNVFTVVAKRQFCSELTR